MAFQHRLQLITSGFSSQEHGFLSLRVVQADHRVEFAQIDGQNDHDTSPLVWGWYL